MLPPVEETLSINPTEKKRQTNLPREERFFLDDGRLGNLLARENAPSDSVSTAISDVGTIFAL